MDDLDRAILCTMDTGASSQLVLSALHYIDQINASPEGWKLCAVKLFQVELDHVTFFCFHVLQDLIVKRYTELQTQEKIDLRSCLLTYLNQKVCNPQVNTSFYIRNKFAQVLVLLFKVEYPSNWPNFFDDLITLVNNDNTGGLIIDIFLRILLSIDQEVASRDIQRERPELDQCTVIKDYMRDHSLVKIVETWYNILLKCHTSKVELAILTLENIKAYIGWIDINLIANEGMLSLFFKFLPIESLREHVMDCIYEIINKGMPHKEKLALMKTLQLKQLITAIPFTNEEDIIDFLIKAAKLINQMGTQTLEALQSEEAETKSLALPMLEDALELLFLYMNHPDDEVSQQTLPFATLYIQMLKKIQKDNLSETQVSHLQLFLQIIARKMEYDNEFNFEKLDEYEDEFLQYRKLLGNIFKIVTLLHPALVASFIHSSIQWVLQLPNANDPDLTFKVEVVLHLFWKMGEGLTEPTLQQTKEFFVTTITRLAKNNLASHPHRAVTVMFFDAVNRYSRFLGGDSEALQFILVSLLDKRGIRNSHPIVRAKCSDIFMRLSKTLRQELVQFLPQIVASIKDLVIFTENGVDMGIEDRLNLFEGLGMLVGHLSTFKVDETEKYMETLLKPLVDQIQLIITQELYKQDTPENLRFTNWLSDLIHATGTFSKGFPMCMDKVNKTSLSHYTRILQLVLAALRSIPHQQVIRSKCIFFLHRMMECMGPAIFEYLPAIIALLMTDHCSPELSQFVILINQLLSIFKDKVGEVTDKLFLPLVTIFFQIFKASKTGLTPCSEEEREVTELKRNYYQFINVIVTNNLAEILISPTNIGQLNEVLQTLLEGCGFFQDTNIQKCCFSILRRLVQLWAGSSESFTKFVVDTMVRVSFEVPWDIRFNLADGFAANVVLVEICALNLDIYQKLGASFAEFLGNLFLPSINCPPEFIHKYIALLTQTKPNPRLIRTHVRTFLQQLRGKT